PIIHNRAHVSGTAEADSMVKLYEGTRLLGTATAAADGSWSVTTGILKHGTHTFVATATDVAGNTSASAQPLHPPGGPHSGATSPTVALTNVHEHCNHTATVKGTADAYSQVKVYDGTTPLGSVKAAADGTWSFNSPYLTNKVHSFTGQEVDSTGQTVAVTSGNAILGSSGNNTIASTSGNDILAGNGHHDTFVFAANFGHDVITDFSAGGKGHDTIQSNKSVFDSFADVLSDASQVGQNVVISEGTDTLTLKNTKLGALNSHDFHFA